MKTGTITPIVLSTRESVGALLYFGVYLSYLFVHPESELLHWVSLVTLPMVLLFMFRPTGSRSPRSVLASIGFRRGNLGKGVVWACLVGLALSVLQLAISRKSHEILDTIWSGQAVYMFPIAFVLMFFTAGFTEEFFFRGVLLTRLEFLFRSKVLAVLSSSVLFGVYHLPYAYFNPNWPSAGDWGAAWSTSLMEGIPGGLILGTIYILSGRNLLACIVTHSLINALPAMSIIRFGGP